MLVETEQPWPRNIWYQAGWSTELGAQPLARTICNQPLVIYRGPDGKVGVLEDRCCHRGAALSMGEVTPQGLQCGYHGMIFDAAGKCVHIPGQDTIPPQARVRSFPVVERQEFIWVWLGDADKADERLIVDYPWNDDPKNWPHKHGMSRVNCNYMLLMDNLMDLTHIPFIHRRTVGGGVVMEQVNAKVDVTRTERGVHFIRWMLGITPPPTYVKGAGFAPGTKVDRWQEFEFFAPASVIQWTGALPVGRNALENRDQPGGFTLRMYHGAAPETEHSCHYFWTGANGYRIDDPAATQQLYDELASTFQEDIAFLETQYARVIADPRRPLIDIKHDHARVQARRAVERMIREENRPAIAAE
jgi:phenylpropionate dioxygenase-like ring-hydroxylating dioxygenase large terminal subunit